MILADVVTASDETNYYCFFHGRRFVKVRYIDGPTGEHLRTQDEAAVAAARALLAEPEGGDLIVS